MRTRRLKIAGAAAIYHCMTRTVNGSLLFEDADKEVLRKMIWQVADFSGVEILTYCIMSNHFHVLVHVPAPRTISDKELMRRYRVLYPKPTKYQTASISVMEANLAEGGDEAEKLRQRLTARMGDVSEFMKAVKQRFSVWFNRSHQRYGTLWAERFKSVLVEGSGNPLQTMAAYIDLNPVRAGLVKDSRDYRFCGYAEAVAQKAKAKRGLARIWNERLGDPLEAHRSLMHGKLGSDSNLDKSSREQVVKVLEKGGAKLPKAQVLRCRVRYFTDGAILGSSEYVRNFVNTWQTQRARKFPPKVNKLKGANWEGLSCIQGLRTKIFS